MSTISDWDNDYARIARAFSQLRVLSPSNTSKYTKANNKNNNPAISKESIQTGLDRLTSQLRNLEQSRTLSISDLGRRRTLIQNLLNQLDSPTVTSPNPNSNSNSNLHFRSNRTMSNNPMNIQPNSPAGGAGGTSTLSSTLQQQDEMLNELASGVGRLKDQSKLIGEEAKMHVHLLDRMDQDVELAQGGMESETMRALKLKEDKSVWKLQLIIAGLTILLVILILSGL